MVRRCRIGGGVGGALGGRTAAMWAGLLGFDGETSTPWSVGSRASALMTRSPWTFYWLSISLYWQGQDFRSTAGSSEQQNWIGGNAHNPCTAVFIRPPPELVSDLVSDLVAFSNDDSLPAVAQAAIAHSQFETIHPFRGWQRTYRPCAHSSHPSASRHRTSRPAAGLSHPCHLGAGLHRWPRRYSVPRTRHL